MFNHFKPKPNQYLEKGGKKDNTNFPSVNKGEYVMQALSGCKIEKRGICVQWKKLRGHPVLFCWPHKLHFVNVSLGNLAKAEIWSVFILLQRGVYNNLIRIQSLRLLLCLTNTHAFKSCSLFLHVLA